MNTTKRIYLHAGPGKTGTSAIQYWCNTHRDSLLKQGVFYPEHALDGNNVSNGHIGLIADKNHKDQFKLNQDKVLGLLSVFESSKCHTLLLSSEYFVNEIEALITLMPSAQVILYYRDPIELMESSYIQQVKRHSQSSQFHLPNNIAYPFVRLLTNLVNKVPFANIILRPYSPKNRVQQDLVADILETLQTGLADKLDFHESININDSYSALALEFKRLCNVYPIEDVEFKLDGILQSLESEPRQYTLVSKEKGQFHQQRLAGQLLKAITQHPDYEKWFELIHQWHLNATEHDFHEYIQASNTQFKPLVDKIKSRSPELIQRLSQIMDEHDYFIVDNPDFVELFPVPIKAKNRLFRSVKRHKQAYNDIEIALPETAPFLQFKKSLGITKPIGGAQLLSVLAEFMDRCNEAETAEKLINKAYHLNANNQSVRNKINRLRKKAELHRCNKK